MKVKSEYNTIPWEDIVYYSDTSSSGLKWKNTEYFKNGAVRIAGQDAGRRQYHKSRNGEPHAWTVTYKRQNYLIHRIIWRLVFGYIPPAKIIDHIDGNPFNNSISNLRLIDEQLNPKNAKKYSSNTSGFTGVQRIAVNKTTFAWVARVQYNNKRLHKIFREDRYTDAIQQAIYWREMIIKELNEQGAGFTERHGT